MTADHAPRNLPFSSPFHDTVRALWRRVVVSIVVPVAWLCFTLLYVGFWAHGFSLFQSVIVILVSILVLFAVMASVWVSFGMSQSRRWADW
jgi:hypothetical protein